MNVNTDLMETAIRELSACYQESQKTVQVAINSGYTVRRFIERVDKLNDQLDKLLNMAVSGPAERKEVEAS